MPSSSPSSPARDSAIVTSMTPTPPPKHRTGGALEWGSSPWSPTQTSSPQRGIAFASGNDANAAAANAIAATTATTAGGANGQPLLRPVLDEARKPSVAFMAPVARVQVDGTETAAATGVPSAAPGGRSAGSRSREQQRAGSRQRRISSPPPPPVFRPRVSFDTFDGRNLLVEENSFTLVRKHKDYEYTKRSRTFLIGLDSNDYSEYALEWLIEELVDDGDEIVALRVLDRDSEAGRPKVAVDTGRYKQQAEALINKVQGKNVENKAINLILEFAVGKVNKVINDMISLYEPAILIVGTRGRSLGGIQGLLPGSVSKYCLQYSPVPVIVVRPRSKREKVKEKRLVDPGRQNYQKLINRSSIIPGTGSAVPPSVPPPLNSNNSGGSDTIPTTSVAASAAVAGILAAPVNLIAANPSANASNASTPPLPPHRATTPLSHLPPDLVLATSTRRNEREEAAAVAAAIGFKSHVHPHYAHVGEPHHQHPQTTHVPSTASTATFTTANTGSVLFNVNSNNQSDADGGEEIDYTMFDPPRGQSVASTDSMPSPERVERSRVDAMAALEGRASPEMEEEDRPATAGTITGVLPLGDVTRQRGGGGGR